MGCTSTHLAPRRLARTLTRIFLPFDARACTRQGQGHRRSCLVQGRPPPQGTTTTDRRGSSRKSPPLCTHLPPPPPVQLPAPRHPPALHTDRELSSLPVREFAALVHDPMAVASFEKSVDAPGGCNTPHAHTRALPAAVCTYAPAEDVVLHGVPTMTAEEVTRSKRLRREDGRVPGGESAPPLPPPFAAAATTAAFTNILPCRL